MEFQGKGISYPEKVTRPNWAKKVHNLELGDGNGGRMKIFSIMSMSGIGCVV